MHKILPILIALVLTGCVAGQEIALHYQPQPALSQVSDTPVSVSVVDKRRYITNNDKDPSYIGHYRGAYGNTWDVTNLNEMPLADQLTQDISKELATLGYRVVGQGFGKSILVTINDFNFDAMLNGRFWYDCNIKVKDNGRLLSDSTVTDSVVISGSFWVGAKYDMEQEVPQYYDMLVRGLIRANKQTMQALEQGSK
jgi:uncharacterized lipoprotein YmbA